MHCMALRFSALTAFIVGAAALGSWASGQPSPFWRGFATALGVLR